MFIADLRVVVVSTSAIFAASRVWAGLPVLLLRRRTLGDLKLRGGLVLLLRQSSTRLPGVPATTFPPGQLNMASSSKDSKEPGGESRTRTMSDDEWVSIFGPTVQQPPDFREKAAAKDMSEKDWLDIFEELRPAPNGCPPV